MLRLATLSLALAPAVGYRPTPLPSRSVLRTGAMSCARADTPQMLDLDGNTLLAIGAGVFGLGGGVGLIALTEQAGKRNEATDNAQPCVVCKGKQVVMCTICQGTGEDQYASLVAGVKEAVGEEITGQKVLVEDWADGPKEVVMYEEILSKYPVKATKNVCDTCGGKGVVVCDNCQGTGIQPRFLERYSPDDFMD